MDKPSIEAIDSRPRKPVLMLSLFIIFYGLFFGTVVFFGVREKLLEGSLAEAVVLASAYLLVALFLLFYVVLSPYRFKFNEVGVEVITWRGRQFFPWIQVKSASLSSYKGHIDLILHAGGLTYITIPIKSFERGASLLEGIRLRLRVKVAASKRQLAAIADD